MPRTFTGESVIARAVRIVEAFTAGDRELSVTELSRRTGLPLATVSRIVAQLVRHGLLGRTPAGQVQVGVRMWELAHRASPALSLREAAMPFLEDLHAVVGHHVQLGVRDGDEVLFLERLSAPGAVITYTRVAGRLPLYLSSAGLVLLAHAPVEVQEHVLAGQLRGHTPRTPTDPVSLRALLADARQTGHVIAAGYLHEEATGVAVPVHGGNGHIVAALSVIVPSDGTAYATVPALHTAARGITRVLTAHPLND